jgi:hypothetical protein
MVRGSTGVIDPKKVQKYMWPFISVMIDLEPAVVRALISSVFYIF